MIKGVCKNLLKREKLLPLATQEIKYFEFLNELYFVDIDFSINTINSTTGIKENHQYQE